MSGSSKNLDKLTPKQRALYELLLKEKKGQLQAATTQALERTIPRRAGTEPAPASFPQQRLWVVDQLEGGQAFAYNVHITVQFTGVLDIPLLARCVNQVVRRHESLRTVFAARDDGLPVQIVLPELTLTIPVEDISHLGKAEQDGEVERRTSEESQRLFDLARGPLLRGKVLRLGPDNHVALVTMHHLVTDRWSLGVFVRELMTFYAAEVTGQTPAIPELAIQYSDFAEWQRERMQGERLRIELDFWKQHLKTLPEPLELPTDRPRPARQTYRGSRQFVTLPVALTRVLKEVSQQEGATLFMTLLATFQTLMHRHSRQTDITVGSPIAGRNVPELESLIGFFVNTLVLRNDLGGDPTFRELLRRAKDVCMAAYAHQELPFEKLVEELQPPRDLSRHPLFQVMFSFQNTPRQDLSMPGLQSTYLLVDPGSAKFDLLLELREDRPDEIFGWLEYNTDLFDVATIQRLRGHFYTLLGAVAANPDTRLSELPLLTNEEHHQLLADFQGAQVKYPSEATLHSLIESQAMRTPYSEAIRFEDSVLTYAQLDSRSNQLAHHLRSLGARPGVLVGVCLERSLDLVVALLGVLKSGAAYVPLDPAYPRERLAGMLEDADAPVLLTHEHLKSVLPPHAAHVLCLDSEWDAVSRQPSSSLESLAGPDSLAYVIFTSGSTGRPKGAMNAHSGVVNRLLWMQQQYALTAMDTVLQKTPFSFDVSVWEFFWPLMTGARLVLAKPGGHQDPAYLVRLIAEQRVSTLHFVPSMLRAFLEEPGVEKLSGLRRVVCSGEALTSDLVARAHARLPASAEVHNLYGPTEAAVDVSFFHCARGSSRSSIPIGRPVANTRLYVLDPDSQPSPVGVPGELFIGGVQVGLGYWRKPHLTAERFIPDAFSATPGARLYRTGDVARWLPDGTLEYLGRSDFQVKLRGFRIELGEVEAALRSLPSISDTVVVVRDEARLVAYVVSSGDVDAAALRAALSQRLPEYMVPSAFVFLDALPLSPSGKVERKALPAPDFVPASREFVAPRTPSEELLASLFASVLRIERVGVTDSFFELGGHSLLGTRLVARLRASTGVELPLRDLFEAPTVELLAQRLQVASGGAVADSGPAKLRPVPRDGDLPLSFAQQRLWFLDQLQPGTASYNLPAALRLEGELDVEALRQSLRALVQRHEVLRTHFVVRDAQPVQVIEPEARVDLPVQELGLLEPSHRDEEARRLMREEALRPFDLARGPLVRATLLRLDAHHHLLLVTVHHIISDGWSTEVMVRELGAFYRQFSGGESARLAPLPIQYADFSVWQRQRLSGDTLRQELDWWKQQLSGAPAALELPTDRPRPAAQTEHGAVLPISLSASVSNAVRELAQREGATPFMILLAVWQLVLSRYSGQDDVLVGSPIANRNRAETEGLVGFFVNTLVLRTRIDVRQSFRELLAQVRLSTLAAYEHQDVPFEKLVEELQPQRDLSRSPLFQVTLTLQNTPNSTLALPGITLTHLPPELETSKYDISLLLEEGGSGFSGVFNYNTDLFDAATLERLSRHFSVLLTEAVTAPDARLGRMSLLTPDEKQLVLTRWNGATANYPRNASIQDLFAVQAALAPDAAAVVSGEESLSYAQLDSRSNQLAHYLRSLGVLPGSRVAVRLDRSADLIVSLLAILKVGAAYVPLDKAWPSERLAFVLRESAAGVVLSHSDVVDDLPAFGAVLLVIDEEASRIAGQPSSTLPLDVTGNDLAYVMFTSGSTGEPKGVCVPHRGVT
ncbi:amino acid adenylation domain-containing protein, partial [Myxococcus sp. AM011]|uniref:non-ribosomal peptide synthetase n=1 Tax=Myxococcus sp. AM011 TaxID=2745200 RepID=UPI001595BC72